MHTCTNKIIVIQSLQNNDELNFRGSQLKCVAILRPVMVCPQEYESPIPKLCYPWYVCKLFSIHDICPRHFLIYYNVRRPSIPFGSSQGWVTMEIRPIPCKQYLPALFCYKFTDTGSVKCCKGIFIRWTVDCVAYEISFFCIVVGVTIFTCIL